MRFAAILLALSLASCGWRPVDDLTDAGHATAQAATRAVQAVPESSTAAETVFAWSTAGMVGVGALCVIGSVIGLVLVSVLRSQGLPLSARGLWLGVGVGVALIATALALETVIPWLIWVAIAALLAGVAYAAWYAYRAIRIAYESPPPVTCKKSKKGKVSA